MTVPVTPQGGEPAAAAATTPAPQVVVGRKETDAFILRLIAKHGSTENALTQLAGEQLRYRKRAQNAETERDTFKVKVPAAGSVVLSGDEAKAYEAIKKLGVALDKVPEMHTALKDLQSKDSTHTRESAITTAAGEKYKPKVLKKLLDGVELKFKKVNVKVKDDDGKDTIEEQQVPYVALKDGDKETLEALDTYLEREHGDWMDVLMADDAESGTTERPASRSAASGSSGSGVVVPRQSATSGKPPKKEDSAAIVDKTLGGKYMTPGQRAKEGAKT